jgi:type I restriction enzyme S subunit
MKISVVNSSKIDLDDRIDAEYFEPTYLESENRLRKVNAKPLSNYCKLVSSAFYPAATEFYPVGEMPFIRCVDCIEFPAITSLQNENFEKLPRSFIKGNRTIKILRKDDIVITKVGTPCYSSIIYDLDELALSRTVLGVCSISNIDPYYLTVYLRSKYGYDQLFRERELTIQYQLTLERVGRILVYKPLNEAFEKLIRKFFVDSQSLFIHSREKYKEAEQILLSELGLLGWKPKRQLTFVKSFLDTKSVDRVDAEYFQPTYDELLEKVRHYRNGYKLLGDIVTIRKCVEPGSQAYEEDGIPFLRVSNLSKFGIVNDNQQYISEELYEQLKSYQPEKGEILLSKDATPGIAYYLNKESGKMIPSGGILRLNVKDVRAIYPEYLTLVLNSVVVGKQIERDIGGSVINHWLVDQVKGALIPILPEAVQKDISDKIADSFLKREQSKKLLDFAKRGVEMAIERSEEEATRWFKEEIESHDVTLKS